MTRRKAIIGSAVLGATLLLMTACVRYVLSPEDEASARLGAKITAKVIGLDAGEEERRQVLLHETYCLWVGELWRRDAGEPDSGIVCRQHGARKDAGK